MKLAKMIAWRLRVLRERGGLSQQDVAEKAELSLSLVAKMEQGRKADPRASTLIALAGALGVRPGELLEDLTPPPADAFPGKGKKGKKKKKKALAALLAAASPTPEEAPAEEPPPATTHRRASTHRATSHATSHTNGHAKSHTNGKKPKKKKKET